MRIVCFFWNCRDHLLRKCEWKGRHTCVQAWLYFNSLVFAFTFYKWLLISSFRKIFCHILYLFNLKVLPSKVMAKINDVTSPWKKQPNRMRVFLVQEFHVSSINQSEIMWQTSSRHSLLTVIFCQVLYYERELNSCFQWNGTFSVRVLCLTLAPYRIVLLLVLPEKSEE